jgi:hypothetical protein
MALAHQEMAAACFAQMGVLEQLEDDEFGF